MPFLLLAEENKSNLEWIESNLSSILDSLQISDFCDSENTTLDFGVIKGEQFGFVKSRIIEFLEENKNKTSFQSDSILLRIEQFSTRIVYVQKSTGFLNLSTQYSRKNLIVLTGWLEDQTNNKILKSLDVNKIFVQKINADDFTSLEKSPYQFTRGTTEELSVWHKTIEPVMVVTSFAVIIYLFFSVRS